MNITDGRGSKLSWEPPWPVADLYKSDWCSSGCLRFLLKCYLWMCYCEYAIVGSDCVRCDPWILDIFVWTLAELLAALWQARSECFSLKLPQLFTAVHQQVPSPHTHRRTYTRPLSIQGEWWEDRKLIPSPVGAVKSQTLPTAHIHRQMKNKWLYIPDSLCNMTCFWAPS